jgi:hypothetical protein
MLHSVKTGEPAVDHIRKMPLFDYLAKNQEVAQHFDGAMTNVSRPVKELITASYDFSPFKTIVDVAGGKGAFLSSILTAFPEANGILFDQKSVVEAADLVIYQRGLSDRCKVESGSFFDSIPEGGDVYILKHIIHDWPDDKAIEILKNVRKSMRKNSKLLLVEAVIAEDNEPSLGKMIDLEMLVATGGKERTEKEYRTLLADAHLKLLRVIPTASPLCFIEAERT